jgi:hypothetical protein
MIHLIVFHREVYSILKIGCSKVMFLCPEPVWATWLKITTTKIQLWCVHAATMPTLHSQRITKYCVILAPSQKRATRQIENEIQNGV